MLLSSLKEKMKAGEKQLAVLIDPDETGLSQLEKIADTAAASNVDYFFIGGSLLVTDRLDQLLKRLKSISDIPTIIFPGSPMQVSSHADGILLLSLISGRNPELLIGHHVLAAPALKNSGLEILPTGYLIIDGGKPTTVSYISGTSPLPADKPDIAVSTALAGEMLGLKLIYLDAGSGAKNPVNKAMIQKVKQNIQVPLIVGGGIDTPEKAKQACDAGADVIVIGNALEKKLPLLQEIADTVKNLKNENHSFIKP